MTTGLSFETLVSAFEACEDQKRTAVEVRRGGNFGIAIDQDDYALWFQRRDRQAEKVRKALLAKAAAQEARIRKLEADNEQLQTLCDNLVENGGKHAHKEARLRKRVAELEAQAAVDAKLREVVLEWAQAKTELDAHLESGPLDMDVVGDLMMTHRLSRERMWEVLTPMLAAREEGG